MFDKGAAADRVAKILDQKSPPNQPWAIDENHTRETPSAWVFFYNSQRYLKTGQVVHKLAGNGPVFVNKSTGEVQSFGSAPPLDVIIENYEKSHL